MAHKVPRRWRHGLDGIGPIQASDEIAPCPPAEHPGQLRTATFSQTTRRSHPIDHPTKERCINRRLDRRRFLQTASLAGFGIWVLGNGARGEDRSPNERLGYACIGVGGKDASDTDHVAGLGQAIEYDGASGRVTNCSAAARYLQPEYRSGWMA